MCRTALLPFLFLCLCSCLPTPEKKVPPVETAPAETIVFPYPGINQQPEQSQEAPDPTPDPPEAAPLNNTEEKEPVPPPRFTQHLTEGITPAAPPYAELLKLPEITPPITSGGSPSTFCPFQSNQGLIYHYDDPNPAILFTVPGASPYFAKLIGADFLPVPCSHKKVMPALEYETAKESARLAFRKATGICYDIAGIQRAGLGVFLSFEGPVGTLDSLGNLFPDVVAPLPDLPYSPLHPFGQQLYLEYYKSYVRMASADTLFFLQPAPPVSHLTRNDLETRKAFRRAMEKKYSTIEEANKVWSTNFSGFRSLELLRDAVFEEPAGPFHVNQVTSRSPLQADWLDFAETNRRQVAAAFSQLANKTTTAHDPLIVLSSRDCMTVNQVAAETDLYLFQQRLSFLPEPGPIIDLRSTYLLELARASGKPIMDLGRYRLPESTPPWQQIALLRHFIWRRLWHGASILALPLQAEKALTAAPRFIAESNLLSHFKRPFNETRSKIVFLHPAETLRVMPATDRTKALDYLLMWWKAAATQGFSTKVLSSEQLTLGNLMQTRAVICPLSLILNERSFSILGQFAQEGGIVITDWDSFQWQDIAGSRKNNTHKFLGLRHIAEAGFKNDKIRLTTGEEIMLQPRPVDDTTGSSVELLLAEAFGFRAGPAGKVPVTAVNRFGNGFIYSILLSLPERRLQSLLSTICWTHGLVPNVKVTTTGGQNADFIEAGCKTKDDKKLVCLFNLGPAREFLVSCAIAEENELFTLRNPLNAFTLSSPSGKQYWSSKEVRKTGFKVYLERGETAIVLIEPADTTVPLQLSGISRRRREMITELSNHSQVGPLFLIPQNTGSPFRYPTARKVIERTGFRTAVLDSPSTLENAACLWINHQTEGITAEEVLSFVEKGRGLFINACTPPGAEQNKLVRNLLSVLKFSTGETITANEAEPSGRQLPVVFFGITDHEITKGINTVTLPYAEKLSTENEKARLLIHSGDKATPAGAPVLYECPYQSGRILVFSACGWADPLSLSFADNAKLLARCSRYLGGRNPIGLSESDLRSALFLRRGTLLEADQEDLLAEKKTFQQYPVMDLPTPFPETQDATTDSFWTTFSPIATTGSEATAELPQSTGPLMKK